MSAQDRVKSTPDRLASALPQGKSGGLPPVHQWNPPFCGDIDMRIARDGTWFYQGSPINRPAMVRLFSSILKFEDGQHYLVTPVEKVGITVDDAPFLAVSFGVSGAASDQMLTFETHVGDQVIAGPEHALRFETDQGSGQTRPYLHVRAGLEALVDRKSFYRLAELAVEHVVDGETWLGVWSGGAFFPMILSDVLAG